MSLTYIEIASKNISADHNVLEPNLYFLIHVVLRALGLHHNNYYHNFSFDFVALSVPKKLIKQLVDLI